MVELVIAIGILSVGLVGAIRVFPVGLRASQRAAMMSRGTLAIQRTLEALKLKPWEELVPGESVRHEEPFDITVAIDEAPLDRLVDPGRLKRIAVTAGWTQEGRQRTLTAVTYIHHAMSHAQP